MAAGLSPNNNYGVYGHAVDGRGVCTVRSCMSNKEIGSKGDMVDTLKKPLAGVPERSN